jgi:DNA-binding transcriptional MerR regulator
LRPDDVEVADPELMSIGAFAKLAGLIASALRFYDDASLLHPEQVETTR